MEQASPLPPDLADLARLVVDAAFKVHKTLGPGLLESVYQACLCVELEKRGIAAEKLLPIHRSQLLTYLKLSGLRLGLLINLNVLMFSQGVKRVIR
jgi:hypothetical protein